jgi:hypothetical protein
MNKSAVTILSTASIRGAQTSKASKFMGIPPVALGAPCAAPGAKWQAGWNTGVTFEDRAAIPIGHLAATGGRFPPASCRLKKSARASNLAR